MSEITVRNIGETHVRQILTMEVCIPLMTQTLQDLEKGICFGQMRTVHSLPHNSLFGFMPAWLGDDSYFGAKVVTAFPANQGTDYPSHMGSVLLFDSIHGALRGMVDATSITAIRTGAVSAVATDLLARKDAHILALLGAGEQARSHLEAIRLVRDIKQVRVYDRFPEAAQRLAEEAANRYDIEAVACVTVEETVKTADIICTVTTSREPILDSRFIKPGTHINAVGAFTPTTREIASDLVVKSRLYADSRESMLAECGEFLIPKAEGLLDESHIVGSIGEVLLSRAPGRGNDQEITLFDALGLAVEDLACARYCYEHI